VQPLEGREGGVVDWTNERYVRLYTRDTDDWLVLTWQAKALFPLMLRKVDRSGFLETKRGAIGVAAQTGLPPDVVNVGLPDLLRDGSVTECDGGYLMPNYIDAQEAPQSDAQRAKELRERRRDRNRNVEKSGEVNPSRSVVLASQNVTAPSPNATKPSLQPDQPVQPSKPANSNDRELTPEQRVAIAANQVYEKRFPNHIQLHRPGHEGTHVLVQALTADSIPTDFAERSVATQAAKLRAPVSTMAYFLPGIREAWGRYNAKLEANGAPRVLTLDRNGQPEQTRPARGGSPPVADDAPICGICGTTETHVVNRRIVPKHKDGCALAVAIAKVGK